MLGMGILAVMAEGLDFLAPELGQEVQTIGDQIMNFELDATLLSVHRPHPEENKSNRASSLINESQQICRRRRIGGSSQNEAVKGD